MYGAGNVVNAMKVGLLFLNVTIAFASIPKVSL